MGARRTDYSEDEDVEDATESESGSDEEDDVNAIFDLAERRVHTLVRQVKGELEDIYPGIGDGITLANFVRFVQTKSSVLAD